MPVSNGCSCDLAHKLTSARPNNHKKTTILGNFRDNTRYLPLATMNMAKFTEKGNVDAQQLSSVKMLGLAL
jgi:hypothetical protein